jgi:hypothetical protein
MHKYTNYFAMNANHCENKYIIIKCKIFTGCKAILQGKNSYGIGLKALFRPFLVPFAKCKAF